MFLDNICATASHKARMHGPGWRTAHASSIDEKGLIVYRQGNFLPASCGYYWYAFGRYVFDPAPMAVDKTLQIYSELHQPGDRAS